MDQLLNANPEAILEYAKYCDFFARIHAVPKSFNDWHKAELAIKLLEEITYDSLESELYADGYEPEYNKQYAPEPDYDNIAQDREDIENHLD